MSEVVPQLAIGEVARRAGMTTSRIRYYEARGLLPEPERSAGKRRYTAAVFRRLAIIDAAQRVGFTLEEIRHLLGSRDEVAHERLRQRARRTCGTRRSIRNHSGCTSSAPAAPTLRARSDRRVVAASADACFAEDQVPDEWQDYTQRNAAYYQRRG